MWYTQKSYRETFPHYQGDGSAIFLIILNLFIKECTASIVIKKKIEKEGEVLHFPVLC